MSKNLPDWADAIYRNRPEATYFFGMMYTDLNGYLEEDTAHDDKTWPITEFESAVSQLVAEFLGWTE